MGCRYSPGWYLTHPTACDNLLIANSEADVFMAERSPADIERNELVSSKLPTTVSTPLTHAPRSLPSRTRILSRHHFLDDEPLLYNRHRLPFARQYPPSLLALAIRIPSRSVAEIPLPSSSRPIRGPNFEIAGH